MKSITPFVRISSFWRKVHKTDTCWLWTGSQSVYGHMSIDKRIIKAHRFSYELAYGPIPKGLSVCHHCDTPLCVRPDHLFVGTQRDNMRDATAKRRINAFVHPESLPRGELHPNARMTEAQVREIRVLAGQGHRVTDLARRYHIGHPVISDIVRRITWKHI